MSSDVGIRRHGDRWEISFYDRGHRVFETVTGSLTRARKVRAQRIHETENRKLGIRDRKRMPTLTEFVALWRAEVAIGLAASTRRGYETALRHHLLPAFGATTLDLISKAAVQKLIAEKSRQQRWDYTCGGKNANPDRPMLAPKTIRNMVATLHSLLESAAEDYELLDRNPLAGILRTRRRQRFPTRRLRTKPRLHVLEPEDFKRALECVSRDDVRRMILFAALTGLRWGELVALRVEDINWRRNRIVVSRALYRRVPGSPKTEGSEGEVPICPTVRRILQLVPWPRGYVFSWDGQMPIGDGSWVKRQWREAQRAAGVARPVSWHDLRHLFVSLLIAAGKHPKYIADAARHRDAGFSMRVYGHLFDSLPITSAEWWDDLLWPTGCPHVPAAEPVADGGRGVAGMVLKT